MSSIPGYTLEAWIGPLLALYEPKREWIEDKLLDFDEESQSWRAYNSAVFRFDDEFEAAVDNLLKDTQI
jgi:hypothetical protein